MGIGADMLMTWHTQFSFHRTAQDLTDAHLRAHLDHSRELLEILLDGGRPSEPAFYMWQHHMSAFTVMGMMFSQEWNVHRGYGSRDFWTFDRVAKQMKADGTFRYAEPPWFRDPDVCRAHRSVLLGVSPADYADNWAAVPEKMPLLWPVVQKDDPAVAELRVAQADLPRLRSGELKLPASIAERVVNV